MSDKSDDTVKPPLKGPAEAHRAGLEQLDHPVHHSTTAKTPPLRYDEAPEKIAEPRQPNQKT
jgi:hypothetical protein